MTVQLTEQRGDLGVPQFLIFHRTENGNNVIASVFLLSFLINKRPLCD